MNERDRVLYELHLAALAAQNALDYLAKICDTSDSNINVKTQKAYARARQLAQDIQAAQASARWMGE